MRPTLLPSSTVKRSVSPVRASSADNNTLPQSVRIIGGRWKRRKLPIAAQIPGLRPSPDRVRETLFNWLGQDLNGWHCVDVCAGTGALGFEAASRGAAQVHMAEQHPTLLKQLRQNRTLLQADAVHIVAGDGLQLLQNLAAHSPTGIDLIFFDPPFTSTTYESALNLARTLLAPNGFFYLESSRQWQDAELTPLGWRIWRYCKAGMVHAHVLQLLNEEPSS